MASGIIEKLRRETGDYDLPRVDSMLYYVAQVELADLMSNCGKALPDSQRIRPAPSLEDACNRILSMWLDPSPYQPFDVAMYTANGLVWRTLIGKRRIWQSIVTAIGLGRLPAGIRAWQSAEKVVRCIVEGRVDGSDLLNVDDHLTMVFSDMAGLILTGREADCPWICLASDMALAGHLPVDIEKGPDGHEYLLVH